MPAMTPFVCHWPENLGHMSTSRHCRLLFPLSMYWLWLALCLSLTHSKTFVQQKFTMLQQQHAYAEANVHLCCHIWCNRSGLKQPQLITIPHLLQCLWAARSSILLHAAPL